MGKTLAGRASPMQGRTVAQEGEELWDIGNIDSVVLKLPSVNPCAFIIDGWIVCLPL